MSENHSRFVKTFDLGLIGFGGFGQFIAEVVSAMPQIRLSVVCDVDLARRELAGSRYALPTFDDPLKLIASAEVEVG